MLKIILKSLVVLSMLTLVLTGCSSKNEVERFEDPEFKGAPKWVMIPQVEGYVTDIGSAQKNAGNDFSFQREEAMADARNNIAKQITIKVNNMFRNLFLITFLFS